ncbi:hypothetical protein OCF84_20760 (plasmid) [Shewanella xiamenensis]|uniref:HNH endonuclease n=1 Tax=Shewanella xiamenensis TaxID=332186 RepID=A0ABT6UFQ5_9GAMM|nr:hypothetical protein [Shewanella xiamenensis]MDI5833300.1 hypothetical protein [Shewanella xiamenensis]WHF57950.1 hypothetical protein OCF84_20760 [Shewanella xiamenensis]
MNILPLVLSVARDLPMDRGEIFLSDKAIKKIHSRDKNKCLFCGWKEKAEHLLHVSSLNHVYNSDLSPKLLATSCQICNYALRLGYAFHSNAGDLIYMPELTQPQVNELARASLICSKSNDSGVQEALEPLLSYIEDERISKLSEYFGIVPFSNSTFASSLREIDKEQFRKRQSFLEPVRFWPNLENLKNIVGDNWDHIYSRVNFEHLTPLANKITSV